MLASLGWHQVIVRLLHQQCILAEVLGCSQTVLIPSIQLCPSDPTIPFNPCRSRFPIKIAFAVTLSKAQGQKLRRAGLYPPSPVFPHGKLCVSYSRSSSFDSFAVATVEGLRQRIGNDTLITWSGVYCSRTLLVQQRDQLLASVAGGLGPSDISLLT